MADKQEGETEGANTEAVTLSQPVLSDGNSKPQMSAVSVFPNWKSFIKSKTAGKSNVGDVLLKHVRNVTLSSNQCKYLLGILDFFFPV